MNYFQSLEYDRDYIIDSYLNDRGEIQTITLKKTFAKSDKRDVFHIKSHISNANGETICQGYMYFYFSMPTSQCRFIGVYIRPEYRNKGIASLLVSHWVRICLDNDISILNTIKKQRKPFLIYMLKKYSFELRDKSLYNIYPKVIQIYQSKQDFMKYLLFSDKDQEREFSNSKIMVHDSYRIIREINDNMKLLDNVILSMTYTAKDLDKAYLKAENVLKRHKSLN